MTEVIFNIVSVLVYIVWNKVKLKNVLCVLIRWVGSVSCGLFTMNYFMIVVCNLWY